MLTITDYNEQNIIILCDCNYTHIFSHIENSYYDNNAGIISIFDLYSRELFQLSYPYKLIFYLGNNLFNTYIDRVLYCNISKNFYSINFWYNKDTINNIISKLDGKVKINIINSKRFYCHFSKNKIISNIQKLGYEFKDNSFEEFIKRFKHAYIPKNTINKIPYEFSTELVEHQFQIINKFKNPDFPLLSYDEESIKKFILSDDKTYVINNTNLYTKKIIIGKNFIYYQLFIPEDFKSLIISNIEKYEENSTDQLKEFHFIKNYINSSENNEEYYFKILCNIIAEFLIAVKIKDIIFTKLQLYNCN